MEIDRPSNIELTAAGRLGKLFGEVGFYKNQLREGVRGVLFRLNPFAATWKQTDEIVRQEGNTLSVTPVLYDSSNLRAKSAEFWLEVGSGKIYTIYTGTTINRQGLVHVDGNPNTPLDVRNI